MYIDVLKLIIVMVNCVYVNFVKRILLLESRPIDDVFLLLRTYLAHDISGHTWSKECEDDIYAISPHLP